MTIHLPNHSQLSSREKRTSFRANNLSNHKVGQDIVFSQKKIEAISSSFPKSFWVLAAISMSFLVSQGLLLLLTK